MNTLKMKLQALMEKKVAHTLATNAKQERSAIRSPHILGAWFYEPQMPERGNEEISK